MTSAVSQSSRSTSVSEEAIELQITFQNPSISHEKSGKKMDLVAELNNEGVTWLTRERYHEASLSFENALQILLSKSSSGCDGQDSIPDYQQKESFQVAPTIENQSKIHGIDPSNNPSTSFRRAAMISFFGLTNDRESRRFTVPGDNDQEEENDVHFSFAMLETRGVVVETHVLKKEMMEIGGVHEDAHRREGERLLFLTLVSAVVLFNMALTNHLGGKSENNSKKLESAARLYRKSRTLLASLNITDQNDNTSSWRNLPFESSLMVDVMYMASWNNEGYLTFCRADFDLSRYCFENLHRAALYFMMSNFVGFLDDVLNPKSETSDGYLMMETASDSIAPLSRSHDHAILLNLLKTMGSDFLLNAAIYRNTMSSPAA